MFRPDHEYQCLLGIYNPLNRHFHPNFKYDTSFHTVQTYAGDSGGCIGSFGITTFFQSPVKAILVARPFRQGGEAIVRYTLNGSQVVTAYSLYDSSAETPRLIWLPDHVDNIVFNINVEDMGYEPSWYDPNSQITDDCDKDFINSVGLYFMYEAHPYYSKLELARERDSQASSGRFLRDKVTTDLTFRGLDYDRLAVATEYDICAVAFYERFEEYPQQDYMAACCYFNRADSEFNQSECYVRPTLKTLDNYSWLLDKYSTEKNIVGIQAKKERVRMMIPPVLQFYLLGANTVTNICYDSCWEQEVANPDVSVNELRKMGFMPVSYNKIETGLPSLVTLRALNIVLTDVPTFQITTPHEIVYALNIVTGEYSFETTRNYDEDPTDEFPYDHFRFRYKNGNVECYDYTNGRIYGSKPYSGVWPPNPHGFATAPRDYMEVDGKWWGAYSANIDANVNIYARMLAHKSDGADTYQIGEFAPLTKWYNWLPYGVDYDWYHKLQWEEYIEFSETNDHTPRPTEYGLYQPDLYYTNENLPLRSYLQGVKPMPVAKSWWGVYSYWVDVVGSGAESWLNSYVSSADVNDCYTLDSVISRLLNKYGVPFQFTNTYVNSRLIYGQSNLPNYLKCRYVYLTPATNITRGKYTQAAQKAMLSLKDLLDELCGMCNAGWHIDKDGLHIEGNEWYDAGHSYSGVNYSPSFDFESVIDEFNNTNTLYGQLVSSPDTDSLWHTLSMTADDVATKHFAATEMQAKAPFCKKDENLSPKFVYDLLEAIATDGVSEDSIICLGSYRSGVYIVGTPEPVRIDSTTIYEVKVGSVSSPVQARILNRAFSWPYLKGRHMFGLPADKSLIDFGWMQSAEYFSTLPKAYTKPHRTMKIRMPIVSSLYTENWQLVKTTLGYGVISRVDIDLITRVATMTVDILEYNLP